MKTLILALLLSTTAFAQTDSKGNQASPNQDAAINMLRSMHMEKTWKEMTDNMVNQFAAMNPSSRADLETFYSKVMPYSAIEPKLAAIYAKHFSQSEMQDIRNFYQTPTGQKSLSLVPTIATESMQMSQQLLMDHKAELQELMKKHAPKKAGSGN